jgi:hypothetical protein
VDASQRLKGQKYAQITENTATTARVTATAAQAPASESLGAHAAYAMGANQT